MATRDEITARVQKKKILRIMKRFDIDSETAKRFYFDRKEAKLEGIRLPFYKWKKKNLNFDDTMDGNDVEQGDFDNFFTRRSRKKIKRKLRKVGKRIKRGHKAILTGGLSEVRKKMKRRKGKIGNILKKISNPVYMANPRNHRKILRSVRGMGKDIVKKDRMRVRSAIKRARSPFGIDKFGNFVDGGGALGSDNTFLNATGGKPNFLKKYKWWLVGGAVAFLFFTKQGKKLIGK